MYIPAFQSCMQHSKTAAGHEAIFILLYVCIIIVVESERDIDGQYLQPALSDFQYDYSHFQYFA